MNIYSLKRHLSLWPQLSVLCATLLFISPKGAFSAPQVTGRPANSASEVKKANIFAVESEAEFFGLLDLQKPELAAVKTAVDEQNWTAAKIAWAKHLETRGTPRWIWSHTDRAAIQKVFDEKFGGLSSKVVVADKILNREFSAQGLTKTLDKYPVWIHGTGEWTNVFNRFNYFQSLGEAYWATGDKKYSEDFVLLLKHWVAKNPVPEEVEKSARTRANPWRMLETGIRTQNWFNAMQFFMDAPEFDAEAKYQMTRSLVEHARRLYEYETQFQQGNWQVVECTGLASAGIMLPEFRESTGWRERSFKYMVEHMQKDVYADGGHWELTPAYHYWVMNQFLDVALLARKNGYEVSGLLDRHEKMYEFLLNLSRPDRRVPGLGDSKALPIQAELGIGSLLYNRPDFRFFGTQEAQAEWVWRFGPDVVERYAKLSAKQPDFLNYLSPQAQYGAMRTGWGENDRYLFFDAAPWGGAHNHQDRLQIELYAGRELLVDPGQYAYDRPLSSRFRTATAHNVLLINGDKQIQADPKVLTWQDAKEVTFTSAQIEDKAFRHQRSVLWFKPNYWVVVDHVTEVGDAAAVNANNTAPKTALENEVTRLFHFPLSLTKTDGNSVQTVFSDGMNLQVQGSGTLQMREDWIPTGGATAEKAPVAAFVFKGQLPKTFYTVLTPFSDSAKLPKLENLSRDESKAHLRLVFPDGQRDEIMIAAQPSALKIGTHKKTGRALIVRRGAQNNTVTSVP